MNLDEAGKVLSEMSNDDQHRLVESILPFARQAIAQQGFVAPVSSAITPQGELARVPRTGVVSSDMQQLLDSTLRDLRVLANEGRVRTVAWCVDMRVVVPGTETKTDALVIFCESSELEPCVTVIPYRAAPGPGTVFGQPYLQRAPRQVFPERPGVFVSPLTSLEVEGRVQTICTWLNACPCLLPKADLVQLADTEGNTMLVAWQSLAASHGHLLEPVIGHPSYWRTLGWPGFVET